MDVSSKSEIKHNILKFTNQINNALTQAYGNVTIFVPQQTVSDEDVAHNQALLDQYKRAVVSKIFCHTRQGSHEVGFLLSDGSPLLNL